MNFNIFCDLSKGTSYSHQQIHQAIVEYMNKHQPHTHVRDPMDFDLMGKRMVFIQCSMFAMDNQIDGIPADEHLRRHLASKFDFAHLEVNACM